jgi:hypothetical protein
MDSDNIIKIEDIEDFLGIGYITDEYLKEFMEDLPWDLEFIKENSMK